MVNRKCIIFSIVEVCSSINYEEGEMRKRDYESMELYVDEL